MVKLTPRWKIVIEHLRDPLYRNSYFLIANAIVPAILSIVLFRILADIFPPSDVGLFTTLLTGLTFVTIVGRLGLDTTLLRFLPAKISGDRGRYVNSILTASIAAAASIALLYVVAAPYFAPDLALLHDELGLAAAFIVGACLLSATTLIDIVFISHRQAGRALAKNSIAAVGRIVGLVIVARVSVSLPLSFVVYVLSLLIVLALAFWWTRALIPGYRPRLAMEKAHFAGTLGFSGANYAIAVFGSTSALVCSLLVLRSYGPEAAAYYYLATAISAVFQFIPQSISTPLLSEGSHDQRSFLRQLKRALVLSYSVTAVGLVFYVLAGPTLLGFMGPAYREGSYALSLIMISSLIPAALNMFLSTVLRLKQENRTLILANAGLAALTIAGVATVTILDLPLWAVGGGFLVAQSSVGTYAAVRLTRALRS